jgi:hypothetical protein
MWRQQAGELPEYEIEDLVEMCEEQGLVRRAEVVPSQA